MKRLILLLALLPAFAFAADPTDAPSDAPKRQTPAKTLPKTPPVAASKDKAEGGKFMKLAREGKDLYATIQTSMGDMVVRLYPKDAPKTVESFVGLATGEKTWRQPNGEMVSNKPLYDNTIFHRVIPGFMIQGGDPTGTGMGDPGYKLPNETASGRKFDKVGLLALANAGPDTNGCQFFVTVSKPDYLNGGYTIFGEVIAGYENAVAISQVPRGPRDRPNTQVTIKTITVSDKQPKAAAKAK